MSIVGVDVGGTFTDIFILDEATGKASVAKVPTTRPDQSGGFLAGVKSAGDDLSAMRTVVHGTTAGTNALLERKGAKIGLITTQGLRDTLEMRRRDRRATWGLRGDFEPVVPRDLRLEVPERTLADGRLKRRWRHRRCAESAARELLAMGCQAVALVFINAYANPANEQTAAQALRALWPNPHVSVSSEILPEIREFERFSTTVLNAYLQPEVAGLFGTAGSGFARWRLWRRVPARPIQWRRHGRGHRLPPARAHRAVWPGSGRDRGGLYRHQRRLDNVITGDGRHQLSMSR
jgi:N-methylhydantoinase A